MIDKQTFTKEHFDLLKINKSVNHPILERAQKTKHAYDLAVASINMMNV